MVGIERPVYGVDVHRDPAELAEPAEVLSGPDHEPDVARGVERVDASRVTFRRFPIDEAR